MTRATARRATIESPSDTGFDASIEHDFDVLETIGRFCKTLSDGLAPDRLTGTVRGWITGYEPPIDELSRNVITAMAVDLTLFTPALSGTTPVDRFLRTASARSALEAEALTSLGRARFRLVQCRARENDGLICLKDLVSGEDLHVLAARVAPSATGMNLALRLCPLASGRFAIISPLLALDEAMSAQAMSFVKPGKGLSNPYRCAAAIYRDVARHGLIEVPLLALENIEEDLRELLDRLTASEVERLALSLLNLSGDPRAEQELILEARRLTSVDNLVDAFGCYGQCCRSESPAPAGLQAAFARIADVQMETVARRDAAGIGLARGMLDRVETEIDRYVAAGQMEREARTLFDQLKRRMAVTMPPKPEAMTELDRVLQRIQGLRAKTVDQGCTEEEALAAAAKVAELLDRYGLTLNEVTIRNELCEGVSIATDRRRAAAVDSCVQAIAAFWDCKAWGEKTASGAIGQVFFGLKADVQAARFLYELIVQAFDTETEAFRRRNLYLELAAKERRAAINSFQRGLANGINFKLGRLKEQRQAAMVKTSGKDLVPLKADLVEEELEKLGMSFTSKTVKRRSLVNGSAYRAGEAAGRAFEPHRRIDGAT
jgi:hypothetical protein